MSAVDMYCTKVICNRDAKLAAAARWNVVWAALRKGSESLARSMYVLEIAILLMIAFAFLDVYVSVTKFTSDTSMKHLYFLIPGGILMIGMCKVFFEAASVSDKCNRVPSLLNSCLKVSAEKKELIFHNVLNSAAGFYLHEMRLTTGILIKFAHLVAVLLLALATRLIE